jgi:hypothetical protein
MKLCLAQNDGRQDLRPVLANPHDCGGGVVATAFQSEDRL